MIPFTTDPNIFSTFLGNIETLDSLPGGSNFEAGLRETNAFLERNEANAHVVLLSDGGDEFVDVSDDIVVGDNITSWHIYGVGSEA